MNVRQVDTQIEALREAALAGDSLALLRAVSAFLRSGVTCPEWLADEFCRAVDLVSDAHVASWDAAFGRPYPAFTRIDVERNTRRLVVLVHRLVWEACLHRGAVVDKLLFAEIAEVPGVNAEATKVEEAYYRGLKKEGLPNVRDSLFYRPGSRARRKVAKTAG